MTTITILLIYLKNQLSNEKQKIKLSSLIFSDVYGKESFNIDVEERKDCMNALFNNQVFDTTNASESVQNITNRYSEIETLFSDEFNDFEMTCNVLLWIISLYRPPGLSKLGFAQEKIFLQSALKSNILIYMLT